MATVFFFVVVLSPDWAKVDPAAVAVGGLAKLRPSVAAMNWNALTSLRNLRRDLSEPLSSELGIFLLSFVSDNNGQETGRQNPKQNRAPHRLRSEAHFLGLATEIISRVNGSLRFVGKQEASEMISVGGRGIRITHPDKLYFSEKVRLTKRDLVQYYLSVAPGAVSGIQDRPVVLKRFVNGAEAPAFYQKRAPEQRPPWLRTVTLSFPSGRTAEEIVVDDAAGLAWIVNLGCIELHPHPVRTGDLEHPDELRVDLDPGPGVAWPDVRRVALEVKLVLEERGL